MTSPNLPASIPQQSRAVEASLSATIAPQIQRGLRNDLLRAAGAVQQMPDRGSMLESDVTVTALTATVVVGRTPADALQAAAAWCREAPDAQVHALAIALVPGPRQDLTEHRLTLTVSFPDEETGEYAGDTHHADGPMTYVVLSNTDE
ncbi:hypothetical protein ACIOJE_35210 [Kitasatospora sp. NPDC087861]|uniref:hypothetical protein n=1 Tax=Kitasatospora sp. NPDC087861 TaxID=3364070 RepID=UPI00381FD69C